MRVKLGMTVAAGLASLMGCASSSASERENDPGEAMFSVRGSVTASAVAISNQLVSALAFTPFLADWGHTDFIVMGSHQGQLLERFELNIYQPPPADALVELTRGEPAIALGGIAIVSPEHPSRLDWERDAQGNMQVCDESGECGPAQQNPCGSLNNARCLGTIVPGKNWGLHGIAGRYIVMYLETPAPAGGIYSTFFAQGQEIPAGYNLFRFQSVLASLTKTDQDAYFRCQQRAQKTALERFNDEFGTQYRSHDELTRAVSRKAVDASLLASWDGSMIEAFVLEGCILPGAQQRVSNPAEMDPLDLVVVAWESPQ
jgi:hypothetical protein